MRVSTLDQHPETQLYDLRQMAEQRGYQIVEEYTDMISGAKARRPGLDAMMRDARRGQFDVVLVWACDRIARSVRHFLEVLDELNRLTIEFVSFRESIDTGGPLGRAVVVIIGAIAELERSLIVERVRAGMRRAKLEGRHIGRKALVLDRAAILRDRRQGHSLDSWRRATWSAAPPSTVFSASKSRLLQKGWKNRPPKPHRIKGRIHPIRLLLNLWVEKQGQAPAQAATTIPPPKTAVREGLCECASAVGRAIAWNGSALSALPFQTTHSGVCPDACHFYVIAWAPLRLFPLRSQL
jgi:DNA invertase Pin-like site-specific DNA recombinase